MELQILSWNIRQGGGSRLSGILNRIKGFMPEILTFSEFRNNASGIALRSGLLKLGYRHQLVSGSQPSDNSVLLASVLPFNGEIYNDIDPVYSGNVVSGNFGAFSVMGVYLPHKKKHILFDHIMEKAKGYLPFIFTGDFNTGINGIDQVGKSFWFTDDLVKLGKHGYIDVFRSMNGDVREYSWFSHQGNGYRYDQTYIAESLLPIVKSCYYLHEWREAGLSDHSPMVLVLGG